MSIVSHTVTTTPQSATRVNAVYTFTDHVGVTVTVNKLVPNAFDTDADALGMYSDIEAQLAESEESQAINDAESGEDVLTIVTTPVHSTSKKIAKALIFHMMQVRDPYFVVAIESVILYLRANYNATQIQSFLDITAAQATKMNTRINAILDNKSFLAIYDANSEEIE